MRNSEDFSSMHHVLKQPALIFAARYKIMVEDECKF